MDYATVKKLGQAVILCGGLGTRMYPHTETLPKPMVLCNGKPFLFYLLEQLADQGVRCFVLLTGYRAKQIEEFFGDGSEWGWEIQYSRGPVDWDTGRRIWEAQMLLDDCFLLLYSDNLVPFPFDRALTLHERNKCLLTFMASPKSPGNIAINKQGIVERYDNDRGGELGFVEIGYMIVEKARTLEFFETPDCSFSTILQKMASKQRISAWIQYDAYHSISDPNRWRKAEEYLKPKKILLIDRDGVINRKAPQGEYVSKWEEFEWIPQTRSAMKQLAREAWQFIVITNQAGIGRGMVEPTELERIHSNMKAELATDGVEILGIYVCPHHWDEGCFCRKPNPGMLYQASREHLFRLDKTLFIGDDPRDCQTAWNAGCGSIFLGNASELAILPSRHQPDFVAAGFSSAIEFIKGNSQHNI